MISILTLTTDIGSHLAPDVVADTQLARHAVFSRDMMSSEVSLREELLSFAFVQIPRKSDQNSQRQLGMAILQLPWKA